MGHEDIHGETAQSSYTIIQYIGEQLPAEYRGFVYSKWKRSLRHGNDMFKLIDPAAYHIAYNQYITNLLKDPETVIRFAVLSEAQDVLLGFSCSRRHILDYVHVLRIRTRVPTGFAVTDFRRKGIGTRLIPKEINTFTHVTKTWLTIWNNKYKDWKFNPFA